MKKLKMTQDARKILPLKACVAPASHGIENEEGKTEKWNTTEGMLAVAFSQKIGGSKSKQDKDGMPDEPGNHQKRRQAKAFRRLKRCYYFEFVLPNVCLSKG